MDDKKENIYLLETLLKGHGYKVVSAGNGAEALEKLRAEPERFDMIISDVLMPVMDGFRFCNECKRDDKLKDIPFVFYTAAYMSEEDEELASKLGVVKYIRKPVEPDEFIKIMQDLVRDARKGKIKSKKPALPGEKEIFKLYSERVVTKLEEHVQKLEKSEREKSKHLHDLGERVKELNCLYEIAKIVEILDISLEGICEKTVNIIPPGWQYPDITCARIIVEGQEFKTANFKETKWKQSANIRANRKKVGVVEVYYLKKKPKIDEGPFLKEERNLIEAIAERLGRVTEHKRAEDALRESEYKYRTLLENLPQRIFLKDKNLVYVSCNEIYARDLKIKPDEIAGKTDYDIFPKEVAEKHAAQDKKCLETGKIVIEDARSLQTGRKGIREWISVVKTPVRDVKGNTVGVLGILWDITERKRAEEQTKRLQEYLQLQVDRMPIGLIVWDPEFRVKTWNPAATKIFGYTEEEALGKHPYGLIVPKEAQPHVDKIWRRLLEGDLTAHSENENITKDGRTIICYWANTPLKEADGTVMGALSMVQDITERKNAEKAMREFIYKVNNISPGECYLHRSRDAAYRTFAQLVLHGVPGICISREKPEKLIEYGIPKKNILLMSSKPLKGFEVIEDLQGASRAISNFLKEHETPVVLLDGLAYLVSRFDFKPVYKFVQEKRFAFVDADAVLLMPIDLATFSDKERALLTSEAKLLG